MAFAQHIHNPKHDWTVLNIWNIPPPQAPPRATPPTASFLTSFPEDWDAVRGNLFYNQLSAPVLLFAPPPPPPHGANDGSVSRLHPFKKYTYDFRMLIDYRHYNLNSCAAYIDPYTDLSQ